MDLSTLSDRKRLVAEQAVETLLALVRAADATPWGAPNPTIRPD